MKFSTFANYLSRIEGLDSRNEITELLGEMFSEAGSDEIKEMCYLVLGHLGPPHQRQEFGISQKLLLRSISLTSGKPENLVATQMKAIGDIGDLTQNLLVDNKGDGLSVEQVFESLLEIAIYSGEGSQELKISGLADLLKSVDSLSARYIARIPVKKLRLGFSDMTILDGLSWMLGGDKSHRKELERAFNVSADIGLIAQKVKGQGIESLKDITVTVGVPVRPAAAERLPTAEAIIEKLGTVSVEPKIDGFRLQMHFERGKMPHLYSRNLEDMSEMFPEIVDALSQLDVTSVVLEGEAVAFDPVTDKMLPFQETMQRRRKHNVEEKAKELPLKVFCFDILFFNGDSYLNVPYQKRREVLAETVGDRSEALLVSNKTVISTAIKLSEYFDEQIAKGLEGIMAKRLDSPYAAGSRNFNWIKLKREDTGDLNDTIDCVVKGYKAGKGRRNKFGIGAFLVGVYDSQEQKYKTISNVGTGLTDDQWKEMKLRADELAVSQKPKEYEVPLGLEQDVWLDPQMVVEVLADTITRSPNHTAGKVGDKPGYALRFPRLVQWRDDKSPEQATSVKEVRSMYKSG